MREESDDMSLAIEAIRKSLVRPTASVNAKSFVRWTSVQ